MINLPLTTGILALLATACTVNAQDVGVQFPGYYDNLYAPLSSTSVAGVVPQSSFNIAMPVLNGVQSQFFSGVLSVSNANLVNSSDTPQAPILLDSTGAATALTFSLVPLNIAGGGNLSSRGVQGENLSGADETLVNQGFFGSAGVSLTLAGLNPTHSYDLIAYVNEPDYYGPLNVQASLGSSSYFLTTTSNAAPLTSYVPSTTTTANSDPTSAYTTANYVEFTGISGSLLNTTTLTVLGVSPNPYNSAATVPTAGLTGFQVVDLGVVPEPSTWAMMLGGLVALAFVARRKINA
jgi:hypothetical protein